MFYNENYKNIDDSTTDLVKLSHSMLTRLYLYAPIGFARRVAVVALFTFYLQR